MRLWLAALCAVVFALLLSGCNARFAGLNMSPQECMARVMYFESIRSSEDGMIAVGTVVMNRVASPGFPNTVCGVVAQDNQFADGVLTRRMGRGRALAFATAAKVLGGTRHAGVGTRAKFFHTAGYHYPYSNMNYVTIAGGNAFYEKRSDAWVTQGMVAARQREENSPVRSYASAAQAGRPGASASAAMSYASASDDITRWLDANAGF